MQIGLGITVPKMGILGGDAGVGLGVGFFPGNLFLTGAAGAWYDPSDFSTLYQTSTGTTPVTAVEQPVGLMLDRSRGLVLGANIAPEISALTANINTSGGSVSTFSAGVWSITTASSITGYPRLSLNVPGIVIGRHYLITFSATWTGGTVTGTYVRLALSGSSNDVGSLTASGGTLTALQVAAATDVVEIIPIPTSLTTTGTITITSLSVRELPGNHALQATSASRPVLRARYNQLTRSEEFNTTWSLVGLQAFGSGSTANAGVSMKSYTGSVDVVAYSQVVDVENRTLGAATNTIGAPTNTSSSIELLADGWCRVNIAMNTGAGGVLMYSSVCLSDSATPSYVAEAPSYTGDGVSGVLTWGASLLSAADQTSTGGAYQRIAAATDYDVSNPVWRPYLAFDGTDDSFGTSAIDFSATDEMTVFAGVHKASDAARATLAELGNNVTSSFRFEAPNAATPTYQFASAGTNLVGTTTSSVYAAPTTNVLTGIGDISADVATLRVNGAPASSNTADQGTGNYGNHALFIGARNNASQRLNGRLYALAVLGRTATAAEISAMEAWVNGKTGAF